MISVDGLTWQALAGMIDHTCLKPDATVADMEKLCSEAVTYGFACVCVHPAQVERCVALTAGRVKVGAAIGFPMGQNTVSVKAFEAQDAIVRGAGEIDMVINIAVLKAGDTGLLRADIAGVAGMCRAEGVVSKVILETCYLTDEEKVLVCRIAQEEGVDFVKTSTGLATGGATVADIRLMRSTVGPEMGVKASGGIRTLDAALAMIAAGATRIGTSGGVAIVDEMKRRA
jgi:deoxyribose-phosphate aldolase